jgi:hypothetical protein
MINDEYPLSIFMGIASQQVKIFIIYNSSFIILDNTFQKVGRG